MKEILQSERGQFEPAGISTTIGLDLGDRWSRYCVVDAGGAVIEEDRVRTSTAGLEHRFRPMPSVRIGLEAGTFLLDVALLDVAPDVVSLSVHRNPARNSCSSWVRRSG